MSDSLGALLACTLAPPTDGRRFSVALTAGQTLVIACDEAVPVLLIREAEALDIDFGAGGTIRLSNGVAAAGLRPVPRIAGRDGGQVTLDRLAALLDPGPAASAPQTTSGVVGAGAELLAMPYGRGLAMPALLDAGGLHPGIPGVEGVAPARLEPETLPEWAQPDEPAQDMPGETAESAGLPYPLGPVVAPGTDTQPVAPTGHPGDPVLSAGPAAAPDPDPEADPGDREDAGMATPPPASTPAPAPDTAPSSLSASAAAAAPASPQARNPDRSRSPGRESVLAAALPAAPVGDLPDMVYGDALLYAKDGRRDRRLTAIRRARRRAPQIAEEDGP